MIINTGLVHSKDIGVGVLTLYYPCTFEVLGDPIIIKDRIEVREHTYANEVYMYVTQSTPLPYERAYLCRDIYTLL